MASDLIGASAHIIGTAVLSMVATVK